jgi:hypothetical protein
MEGGAMSSYLETLLEQMRPLEPHEIASLREWLVVLRADCMLFGETPEDTARMDRIKRRIRAALEG